MSMEKVKLETIKQALLRGYPRIYFYIFIYLFIFIHLIYFFLFCLCLWDTEECFGGRKKKCKMELNSALMH